MKICRNKNLESQRRAYQFTAFLSLTLCNPDPDLDTGAGGLRGPSGAGSITPALVSGRGIRASKCTKLPQVQKQDCGREMAVLGSLGLLGPTISRPWGSPHTKGRAQSTSRRKTDPFPRNENTAKVAEYTRK